MGRKQPVGTDCYRPEADDHGIEFGVGLVVFVMTFFAFSRSRAACAALDSTDVDNMTP